ncbi:MAG: MBL fold metallo-hydrolase [Halovenus sp.]
MTEIQCKGHREMAPGMHFIQECIPIPPAEDPEMESLADWYEPGRRLHLPQNAYLIDADETLLFDTLTPVSGDVVVDEIDEILDGTELDYLVVSHPEANHAGNVGPILEAYPEATLVAPARSTHHDLFHLGEDSLLVEDGDTIGLGEREVEFLDPVFYDHAMTTYMRETTTNTLFTVDFLGFEHMDSGCLSFADELETDVTASRLERFNSFAFVWFRYVDTDQTDAAIEYLIESVDPDVIAPAHGQVIRTNPAEYLRRMKTAIENFSDMDSSRYHEHGHKLRRTVQ